MLCQNTGLGIRKPRVGFQTLRHTGCVIVRKPFKASKVGFEKTIVHIHSSPRKWR